MLFYRLFLLSLWIILVLIDAPPEVGACGESNMNKQIIWRSNAEAGHWVGDGFPVRSLFSYATPSIQTSPFLLLDYAGPHYFEPTAKRRGVGVHPHRGFETVTIVYDGAVEHRDSEGNGGEIGPGDVQWMTAGRGILHQEYHAPSFAKSGGVFRVVQLWVNLPAKDKMAPGGYQTLLASNIPVVELPGQAGSARVIAGTFCGAKGPARTFTPMNVWDLKLAAGKSVTLDLPVGHTSLLVGLGGKIEVADEGELVEANVVSLSREGDKVSLYAVQDAQLLVLTGEPINEPIVGHGPFVMNSQDEIRTAVKDFTSGQFGSLAEA